VRGWKALGTKLLFAKVKEVKLLTPKAVEAVSDGPKVTSIRPVAVEEEAEVVAQLGLF
jgi:topoisomerase-4 subunit A